MTADIRTAAQREIRLDHLLGTFAVGSRDHSWTDEYTEIAERSPGKMHILVTDIRAHGIREPILLGNDGRVWDGHHRIVLAIKYQEPSLMVEMAGADGVN